MAADKMILGNNIACSTDSSETGLNNNVIVCGCSGCGKTMSVLEPRLLETYDSSLIITVTKRRIVDKYKAMLERRGYIVEDLNFTDPAASNVSYDPLRYINSHSDVTFLAESIVMADPKKDKSNADPYWDKAAVSLLSAEILYVLMTKKNASFADVLEMHDEIDIEECGGKIITSVDEKFEWLAQKYPGCLAVSCWRSFRETPVKTAGCIFGTLNTCIDTIFTPDVRKMISGRGKVDFEQLASRKTVLFVSTSAVNRSLHCLVNIFYAQAFKALFEYAECLPHGKLPVPVHVLCDDFATGSRILDFPEYISIFREKQLAVTILIQSESQLESMYGTDDATTIINNCDTYLFLGSGMDLKTGRSISERLNVPLEDVLYMPIGQEVVFRRGQRPIITTRYNITENEQYQQITQEYEKRMAGCSR